MGVVGIYASILPRVVLNLSHDSTHEHFSSQNQMWNIQKTACYRTHTLIKMARMAMFVVGLVPEWCQSNWGSSGSTIKGFYYFDLVPASHTEPKATEWP